MHLYFQTWLYFVNFFDKIKFHFLVYNTINFTMQVIFGLLEFNFNIIITITNMKNQETNFIFQNIIRW